MIICDYRIIAWDFDVFKFNPMKSSHRRCACGMNMLNLGGTYRSLNGNLYDKRCYIVFRCPHCNEEELYSMMGDRVQSSKRKESHFKHLAGTEVFFMSGRAPFCIVIDKDFIYLKGLSYDLDLTLEAKVVIESQYTLEQVDQFIYLVYNDRAVGGKFFPNNHAKARLEISETSIAIDDISDAKSIERALLLKEHNRVIFDKALR